MWDLCASRISKCFLSVLSPSCLFNHLIQFYAYSKNTCLFIHPLEKQHKVTFAGLFNNHRSDIFVPLCTTKGGITWPQALAKMSIVVVSSCSLGVMVCVFSPVIPITSSSFGTSCILLSSQFQMHTGLSMFSCVRRFLYSACTCIVRETFLVFDLESLLTIHVLCFATANCMNIELKMTGVVSNLKRFHTNHFYEEKFVVFFRQVLLSRTYSTGENVSLPEGLIV